MQKFKTIVTIDNKYKTIDTIDNNCDINKKNYGYDCDDLYLELSDLVNSKFRAWYMSHFYRLGREKVLQLASIARADGKRPERYFSKLLKEA